MEGNNTERFTMLENCASAQHLTISLEANRMKYREVNGMGQKTYATIKSMSIQLITEHPFSGLTFCQLCLIRAHLLGDVIDTFQSWFQMLLFK